MTWKYNLQKIKGHFSDQKSISRLGNFLYHLYRRNSWMLSVSRFFKDYEEVEINKPVFLLGTHGGGLTLISRMIRRNKNFVSVSGNHQYWTGADEMAVVLGPILPSALAGIKHKIPEGSGLKVPTNWLYATDENLKYFRKTKEDVTSQTKRKFRKIIRWQIARHASNAENVRFIDKSQIYTVKLSFLNEILKDTDPKFLLITRNPYAVCFRQASSDSLAFKNNDISSFEKKLEVSCEHWNNSMRLALQDSKDVDSFFSVKFEDILLEPEENLKQICNFIEVDFNEDMLPQPEHKIPFGSKGQDRWHPLRPEVNQKYFEEMNQEDVEKIDEVVGATAQKLGYSKPNVI